MCEWDLVTEHFFCLLKADETMGRVYLLNDSMIGQTLKLRFSLCVESESALLFFVLRVPIGGHKGIPSTGKFPYISQVCAVEEVRKGKEKILVPVGRDVKAGERLVYGFYNPAKWSILCDVGVMMESLVSY